MDDMVLVRPSEPRTESIARISMTETAVRIFFPEKGAGFNELVKRWGYFWRAPYFSRDIPQAEQADRAAELAYTLLAAGFCVKGPSAVMETAVSQAFATEPVRIIRRQEDGEYAGWFRIWWHKERGGSLNNVKKGLRGARWHNGRLMVPPEQVEAVMDFAERYECVVTEAAYALADEARAERDAAIVVTLSPLDAPTLPQANGRPPVLTVDEFEIDDSLMDEEE
jgi:hypothetical protein